MVTRARQPLVSSAGLARWSKLHSGERDQPARDVPARHLRPAAHRYRARLGPVLGHNTARVFLHDQLWAADQRGFQTRLGQFVDIAARHRIKPLFVFFDSCWDPQPRAGRQRAPRPGVHNSGWAQSPGAERLGDPKYVPVMHDYVTAVMTQFRNDDRILGWDLWNEPDNPARQYRSVERSDKEQLVANLLPQVFRVGSGGGPSQPLTSGVWRGDWGQPRGRSAISDIQLANADVVTFHSYAGPAGFENRINELTPLGRPILCTEYMARPQGSTVNQFCRLPSATTSAPSTGAWWPARPRPTSPGTHGITPTPRSLKCGFTI